MKMLGRIEKRGSGSRSRWMVGMGVMVATSGWAWSEPGVSKSHVGYVYPAGAQQGKTLEITAGGMGLRKIDEIFISGQGVKAEVVEIVPNFKKTYIDYLRSLTKKPKGGNAKGEKKTFKNKTTETKTTKKTQKKKKGQEIKIPVHYPDFRGVDHLKKDEVRKLMQRFYKQNKQKNRQLDDRVLIKLTVDSDAEPGMREMRFRTSGGLTAPVRFFVGEKPEVNELEPNDRVPTNNPITPPFLVNGQIMPGDEDLFQFSAKEGQRLLIQAHARAIVPYLADAVPGWFQATLTLFDSEGHELSYSDAYRFSQDPVLFYQIPDDGIYTLRIRDSVYRGREDFVYRISVGEDPFVTSIFPMGGKLGNSLKVKVDGWDVPIDQVALNMNHEPGTVQKWALKHSNKIPYAVDEFTEVFEAPRNNTLKTAQKIKLPVIVNGRINTPGDVDVYQFEARPGDRLVVDVNARRLDSPMDSFIRLMDSTGYVMASNDDFKELNFGMQTHHADSRLSMILAQKGTYFLEIKETQGKGGDEYAYRLRVSHPHPDFSLTATPSSITVSRGCSVPITVHALRKDGFDGEIKILLKGGMKGFKLAGGLIPKGEKSVRMTLTAPMGVKNKLCTIRLQGRSKIDRGVVTHDVLPGIAMTQAFITQHVVPADEMMVYVAGWGEVVDVESTKNARVQIPAKGETSLRIKRTSSNGKIVLKLYQAPAGITLEQKRVTKNAISILLKSNGKAKVGTAGNLIIEVLREQKTKSGKLRVVSLGVMPAIPFEMVE